MTKEIKYLYKVPVDNKSKNADTFNWVLNKENATSNKKKFKLPHKKRDKNPRLFGNSTRKDTPLENNNKAQSSATNDDIMNKKKRIYSRKSTSQISTRNNKTTTGTWLFDLLNFDTFHIFFYPWYKDTFIMIYIYC